MKTKPPTHRLQNPTLPDQPKAEHKETPELDQPEVERVYKIPLKQKPIAKIAEDDKTRATTVFPRFT